MNNIMKNTVVFNIADHTVPMFHCNTFKEKLNDTYHLSMSDHTKLGIKSKVVQPNIDFSLMSLSLT